MQAVTPIYQTPGPRYLFPRKNASGGTTTGSVHEEMRHRDCTRVAGRSDARGRAGLRCADTRRPRVRRDGKSVVLRGRWNQRWRDRCRGRLAGATAGRVVDAKGLVVVPGFIDVHSHADGPNRGSTGLRSDDSRRRAAPNLVTQGITTVVVNQDGRSMWPIAEQVRDLRAAGFGPNVALMIGHGTIRRLAMGDDFRRPATPAEVDHMRALVRQGMEEGALGRGEGRGERGVKLLHFDRWRVRSTGTLHRK